MVIKEKLEGMRVRYHELNELIADASVVARQDEWKKLAKEHSVLQPIIDLFEDYCVKEAQMIECKEMMKIDDKEMADLAEAEYYELRDETD